MCGMGEGGQVVKGQDRPVNKSLLGDQAGFVWRFPRDTIAAPGGRLEERTACRVVERASAGYAPAYFTIGLAIRHRMYCFRK
jgi:hypothetical protein